MGTKNYIFLTVVFTFVFLSSCKKDSPISSGPIDDPIVEEPVEKFKYIPPSSQRNGDAAAGYQYLVYGDYIDSGVPVDLYLGFTGQGSNRLNREGDNANIRYSETAVNAPNGQRVVTSNCLTCHAQTLNGQLVMGLGNTISDYTVDQATNVNLVDQTMRLLYGETSAEWEAYETYSRGIHAIADDVITEVRGVNSADKLAVALASHINKHDLTWLDEPQLPVADEVIPTDVPAWWLLKKKNTMFYSGLGRGDFARIMIASNGLATTDSTKAREIDNNFDDVLAYIFSLEAPEYPEVIDATRVLAGENLFNEKCATCHGSYGDNETYPNLLVSVDEVGTDPHLVSSNFAYSYFVDWYNTSWFSKGENRAYLKAENGYMAPPLDGIWATAPYLHNGSIPTLEDLLNSSQRPEKWKRSFGTSASEYDNEKVGWKYTVESISGSSLIYDTTLKGYGNEGHTYADDLTEEDRKDLIEYLKTL